MAANMKEVQWSELQRDPKAVAELVDAGDVRVIRRDGANLLLTREDRVVAAEAGAVVAARALRHMVESLTTDHDAGTVGNALAQEFPWLRFLPPRDLEAFAHDFVSAALAAAELARWEVIEQVVREWKATAVIYSDPALARELARPLTDDLGEVPSPMDEG